MRKQVVVYKKLPEPELARLERSFATVNPEALDHRRSGGSGAKDASDKASRLTVWPVLDFWPTSRYPFVVLAPKRILTSLFFAFAFFLALCPTRTQAQGGGYRGTIVRNPPASYVLQMDDGSLLDAEWNSGYDAWSVGDRVILTTESGGGFMFYRNKRTQVDVFAYDPSEIDDEGE